MWTAASRAAAAIARSARAAVGDHTASPAQPPGRQPITQHVQPSVGCPIIYDSGQYRRVAPDSGNACEET